MLCCLFGYTGVGFLRVGSWMLFVWLCLWCFVAVVRVWFVCFNWYSWRFAVLFGWLILSFGVVLMLMLLLCQTAGLLLVLTSNDCFLGSCCFWAKWFCFVFIYLIVSGYLLDWLVRGWCCVIVLLVTPVWWFGD